MQNVYEICFYGGLVLAILLLIAAIVLFIVLKIPKVIGELTGSAAKKAMKEMQDGTASPGSVEERTGKILQHGKWKDHCERSGFYAGGS